MQPTLEVSRNNHRHRKKLTSVLILDVRNSKYQSCIKYSTNKYQYQYQYQWSKYQYKYQYPTFKYQYQYKYCA